MVRLRYDVGCSKDVMSPNSNKVLLYYEYKLTYKYVNIANRTFAQEKGKYRKKKNNERRSLQKQLSKYAFIVLSKTHQCLLRCASVESQKFAIYISHFRRFHQTFMYIKVTSN